MQHDAMVTTLRALKLFGMAQAVTDLAQQGAPVCIPTERDRGFRRMMTAESDDVDR